MLKQIAVGTFTELANTSYLMTGILDLRSYNAVQAVVNITSVLDSPAVSVGLLLGSTRDASAFEAYTQVSGTSVAVINAVLTYACGRGIAGSASAGAVTRGRLPSTAADGSVRTAFPNYNRNAGAHTHFAVDTDLWPYGVFVIGVNNALSWITGNYSLYGVE